MSKRKRFITTSLLLSVGFVIIQLIPDQYKIISIISLSLLTLFLFIWSLFEGLGLNFTLVTLILPIFYTVGVGFFWFLLPVNIFVRIPIVVLYGLGIYALCLTSNIYTVSAIRTIALLRAARGVGFVLTLLTFFLIFDTILSLKYWIYITGPAVFLSSLLVFFQGYWTYNLDRSFSLDVLKMSLVSSLVMAEIALALFFWPVSVVVGSLFLTVTAYLLLGLGQAQMEGRLFSATVREYLYIGIAVFIGMLFVTHWG